MRKGIIKSSKTQGLLFLLLTLVASLLPSVSRAAYIPKASKFSWSCDGSRTVQVQFTLPDAYVRGESLKNHTLNWALTEQTKVNGVTVTDTLKAGQAKGGSVVNTQFTYKKNNTELFVYICVSDSIGTSSQVYMKVWVGGGRPKSPNNAKAVLTDSRTAHITWEKPNDGSEDRGDGREAYVNMDSITYTIKRQPGNVTVAENLESLNYDDILPDTDYQIYHYEVYASFRSMLSSYFSKTNSIGSGRAFNVPYSEYFEGESHNLWTTIDGNDDDRSWIWAGGGMKIYSSYRGRNGADWLFSPPVHLEAATRYKLNVSTQQVNTTGKSTIGVMLTQSVDTAVARTDNQPLMTLSVDKTEWTKNTQEFSVATEGDYRIAFIDESSIANGSYETVVDSIEIRKISYNAAPDSVMQLKAERAEEGQLKVQLSFIAPTKTTAGEQLDVLDSIIVVRTDDGVQVSKLTDVEPGKAYTITDASPATGVNTYSVNAYLNGMKGRERTVSTRYVGLDIPSTPLNAHLQDNYDGTITLTWQPASEGANGGYVDVKSLRYDIYENSDTTNALATNLDSTTFTRTLITIDFQKAQSIYRLRIIPHNETGKGEAAYSNYICDGAPYKMPFHEGWAGHDGNHLWWTTAKGVSGSGSYWHYTSSTSADRDTTCIGLACRLAGDEAMLTSGKIYTKDANNPVLDYYYFGQPGKLGILYIDIVRASTDEVTVDSVDLRTDTLSDGVWHHRIVNLKPYLQNNEKYINVTFRGKALTDYDSSDNSVSPQFAIDDITVRDLADIDLAAELKAPAEARVSKAAAFDVTITNESVQKVDNFTISLYANGEKVDETSDTDFTGMLAKKTYRLSYTPKASDKSITVYAVVSTDGDANADNNTTAEVTLSVDSAMLNTVDDLQATLLNDNEVQLTWTAPSKAKARYYTEDFESYHPWDLNGFGDWKVIDVDKRPTHPTFIETWPTEGEPFAFQIYNKNEVYEKRNNLPGNIEEPHSGNQMAFNMGMPNDVAGANDDWLISPELSGNAQKIEFYYNIPNNTTNAKMAILTSTTGNDITDFTCQAGDTLTLANNDGKWHLGYADESTVKEGTKYFAFHVISDHAFYLFIDDVKYQPALKAITGYNVYVDGKFVGTVPAGTTSYNYNNDGSNHDFNVTVNYENGESSFSNTASVVVTGIEAVDINDESKIKDCYNSAGIRLLKPEKGINIIRMSDGSTRKVFIK